MGRPTRLTGLPKSSRPRGMSKSFHGFAKKRTVFSAPIPKPTKTRPKIYSLTLKTSQRVFGSSAGRIDKLFRRRGALGSFGLLQDKLSALGREHRNRNQVGCPVSAHQLNPIPFQLNNPGLDFDSFKVGQRKPFFSLSRKSQSQSHNQNDYLVHAIDQMKSSSNSKEKAQGFWVSLKEGCRDSRRPLA